MRSIHSVEVAARERMRHPEELKLSSLFRCKELAMTMMVSSCLVPQTYPGSSIQPSDAALRRESIFPCLRFMHAWSSSRSDLEKRLIIYLRTTSLSLQKLPKVTLAPILLWS
jgi:hypothetical protein